MAIIPGVFLKNNDFPSIGGVFFEKMLDFIHQRW